MSGDNDKAQHSPSLSPKQKILKSRVAVELGDILIGVFCGSAFKTLCAMVLDLVIIWALLCIAYFISDLLPVAACSKGCFSFDQEAPCCVGTLGFWIKAAILVMASLAGSAVTTYLTVSKKLQRSALSTAATICISILILSAMQLPFSALLALMAALFIAMFCGYRIAL